VQRGRLRLSRLVADRSAEAQTSDVVKRQIDLSRLSLLPSFRHILDRCSGEVSRL
jgi:hypothetical protein